MKYSFSMVTLALCLSASYANAQSFKAELQQKPAVQQQKIQMKDGSPSYGVYQLQTELVAVPQALADRAVSKKDIGSMSLVSNATAGDLEQAMEFRRNAVVQNRLTGELGVVTGNISLLNKKGADIQDLLQQFDLKIVRAAGVTGVYIVKPQTDVNLLGLVEKINASGLVKTARMDILEKKYTNQ